MAIAFILVRQESVQNYLAKKTTTYLSKKANATIQVEKVFIKGLKKIELQNLIVKDTKGNILLNSGKLEGKIKNFNFKEKKIFFKKVKLENSEFNLTTYKNDTATNLKFFLDLLKSESPSDEEWNISFDNIDIKNSYFRLKDENTKSTPSLLNKMNYHISNANVKDFIIASDTISFTVNNLKATDESGFKIKKLSTTAKILKTSLLFNDITLKSSRSNLNIKHLSFKYKEPKDLTDFVEKVRIRAEIESSTLSFRDLTYFAPGAKGMTNTIAFSGTIKGKVNNIRAKNLKIRYGDYSRFDGDLALTGLPEIKETFIHLKAKNLQTHIIDINNFRLPGGKNIDIPEKFTKFGETRVSGSFTGFYNDFVSYGDFYTDLGHFSTDIVLKDKNSDNIVEYVGKIRTYNFEMGRFLETGKLLGRVSMIANISGQGFDAETVDIEMNGILDTIVFQNQKFNNVYVKGDLTDKKFNGNMIVKDDKLDFDFQGLVDLSKEIPLFNFNAKIRTAKLSQLNWIKRAKDMNITTNVKANFEGFKLNDFYGSLVIDSTIYHENDKNYFAKNISITTKGKEDSTRTLSIKSDYVDASMTGHFALSTLVKSIENFGSDYMSAIFEYDTLFPYINKNQWQDFTFKANIKNFSTFQELFIPSLELAKKTSLEGSFFANNKHLKLKAESDFINYKGVRFNDFELYFTDTDTSFLLTNTAKEVIIGTTKNKEVDKLYVENLKISNNIQNNISSTHIIWDDADVADKNKANLFFDADFTDYPQISLTTEKSELIVNEQAMIFEENRKVDIKSGEISFNNLAIIGDNSHLRLNGVISKNTSKKLFVDINNVDISLSDFFLNTFDLDLDGFITGHAELYNLSNKPSIISNFSIKELSVNKTVFGDAAFSSKWLQNQKAIQVNCEITSASSEEVLNLSGLIKTTEKENPLEFDIALNAAPVGFLYPYLNVIFNEMEGSASGNLKFNGSFKDPELIGEIIMQDLFLKVNFLNIPITINDKLVFTKNSIDFNKTVLKDKFGNEAICDGWISHKGLKEFYINLTLEPENFLSLNTEYDDNSLFYGDAFSSGLIFINGTPSDIRVDVRSQTEKGTAITVPISYDIGLTDNYFIRFKGSEKDSLEENPLLESQSGLNFDMEANITEDAEIEIILPYQLGTIKGVGNGDLKFNMDADENFLMYGDYYLNSGSFLFSLQNLLSRNFDLVEGSKISWSGDPLNASINIEAISQVKASLSGLLQTSDSLESITSSVPVDCIIRLSGSLYNPNVHFSIDLPNADRDVRDLIFQALDTTNTDEMNRQMISLLAISSFTFETTGESIVTNIGSSSLLVLTNQINNWLSQISKDVDFGIDYRPSRSFTADDVRAIIKTKLFNDRLIIDSSIGLLDNEFAETSNNTFASNINIEYKVTKDGRIRIRAFNRTNETNFLNIDKRDINTQGVGIFYRKEFDNLGELFRKKVAKYKN